MKLAYLSGPISELQEIDVYKNVLAAAEVACYLRKNRISVIIPHTGSMFHHDALTHEEWLEQDIKQLSVCDIMYILPNWGKSVGCKAEVEFALENYIPIQGVTVLDGDLIFVDYEGIR